MRAHPHRHVQSSRQLAISSSDDTLVVMQKRKPGRPRKAQARAEYHQADLPELAAHLGLLGPVQALIRLGLCGQAPLALLPPAAQLHMARLHCKSSRCGLAFILNVSSGINSPWQCRRGAVPSSSARERWFKLSTICLQLVA